MFVINSEIIPVTYKRGLFVLKLDPTTGANETRVSIVKVSGVTLTPHSLVCMGPIRSLLKVMAAHHRKPYQGEGHLHVEAIASYITPCSLRACQLLIVTASYMTAGNWFVLSNVDFYSKP